MLPEDLLPCLSRDYKALCAGPCAQSWTSLLVGNVGIALSWAQWLGDLIRKLGVSVAWMVLGAERALLHSCRLQVPNEATLIIDQQ